MTSEIQISLDTPAHFAEQRLWLGRGQAYRILDVSKVRSEVTNTHHWLVEAEIVPAGERDGLCRCAARSGWEVESAGEKRVRRRPHIPRYGNCAVR